MILTDANRGIEGHRHVAIKLAVGLNLLCLASVVLGAVAGQWPVFIPIQAGRDQVVVEIDRSPDCPNGMLGICDKGGSGPLYLSVWRYAWSSPISLTGQRLFALPVAP